MCAGLLSIAHWCQAPCFTLLLHLVCTSSVCLICWLKGAASTHEFALLRHCQTWARPSPREHSRLCWVAMPFVPGPDLRLAAAQFTDANEFEDAASEYDDATSRLGSMSMSSMYASDDESASPPGWQTGSPGLHSVGVPTCHCS